MRRAFFATRFEKKLKEYHSKHPEFSAELEAIITAIATDAHAPTLKTHRLHGQLRDCLAARITHQYRIAFVLDFDRITFIDIGTHARGGHESSSRIPVNAELSLTQT